MVITLLPSLPSYSSLLHTAEQEMSQGVFFLNCVLESSKKKLANGRFPLINCLTTMNKGNYTGGMTALVELRIQMIYL